MGSKIGKHIQISETHPCMAPRKLSDSDKQQITKLYCQPGETTSTLASRFGVSSSTVSRVLKQMLSDDDYAQLMQWKRSGERGDLKLSFELTSAVNVAEETLPDEQPATHTEDPTEDPEEPPEAIEEPSRAAASKSISGRRSRRRTTATSTSESEDEQTLLAQDAIEETEATVPTTSTSAEQNAKRLIKRSEQAEVLTPNDVADSDVAAWVSEGLEAESEYDADEDEDEDWEEDWDDETDEDEEPIPPTPRQEELSILSFEDFTLKKPCYLVVDRLAELITCPLKEFAELGLIPEEEEQARTLPVFDNHRVARRFARRNQRIIKVPNALMLSKTQEYLQAKGITRLLFDGQVYALN